MARWAAVNGDEQKPQGVPNASVPRWTAKDAWKCLGMFLVLLILLALMLAAFGPVPRSKPDLRWSQRPVGFLFVMSAQGLICTLTALYFARVESWADFRSAFCIGNRPGTKFWYGIGIALTLQACVSLLSWGQPQDVLLPQWGFYAVAYLLAPFWEEIVFRGFIFPAFRGSYNYPRSVFLMVVLTWLTHTTQALSVWYGLPFYAAFAVLQCWLRERSGSLWNCIASHFAFNAVHVASWHW